MAKQYTEAEFAALMRAQNPESLGKLSDSAVLQQTFKEFPDLKERVLPPPPPAAVPAAPAQPTMRELGLQAFKAMAGQVQGAAAATGRGLQAAREAAPKILPAARQAAQAAVSEVGRQVYQASPKAVVESKFGREILSPMPATQELGQKMAAAATPAAQITAPGSGFMGAARAAGQAVRSQIGAVGGLAGAAAGGYVARLTPADLILMGLPAAESGIQAGQKVAARIAALPKEAAWEYAAAAPERAAPAQEGTIAPAAETIAAGVETPAAVPATPAPKGKLRVWDMTDEQIYDHVNEHGSYMPAGKPEKEIMADLKKWRAMGAERKWAAEAEIYAGHADRVPPEVIKKYKLGKDVKIQAEALAAEKKDAIEAMRQEQGSLYPLLNLTVRGGYLNKAKVLNWLQVRSGGEWKGNEIPEELARYVRPSGTMSPEDLTQAAYRLGVLPENDAYAAMEKLGAEHAMRAKQQAGGDITEIRGGEIEPKFQTGMSGMYAARKPAPRVDLPGQTFIPGSGPAMPTEKIRPGTNVDPAAFLEGFQPEPAPAPGLFDEPKKQLKLVYDSPHPLFKKDFSLFRVEDGKLEAAGFKTKEEAQQFAAKYGWEIVEDKPKIVPGGDASTAAPAIDQPAAGFQPITGDKEFKLWQATDDLINKYALRFGERQYIPRGAVGVFYQDTKNIYLQAANNVYVAVHEIVHYIDLKTGWFNTILEEVGKTKNGLPIYSREHIPVRKLLTQIYLDTYPGAKPGHPLKKRVKEGLAMLLQKAVESPEMLSLPQYKPLADMVLAPGGKYHLKEFDELVKDARGVMKQYAALDDNAKIGARVGVRPPYKNTFFTTLDQVNEVLFDEAQKVYKLSKATGNQWGANDPYAQLQAYRYWGSIADSNMSARGKGLWILLDDNFVKVNNKNIADLFDEIGSADQAKRFNNWLIARRVRAGYQQIEAQRQAVLALTEGIYDLAKPQSGLLQLWLRKQEILLDPEQFRELKEAIQQGAEDYKEAAEVAANDNIGRELAEKAYTDGVLDGKFPEWAKTHDAIKRAGVDMLEDAGMIKHSVAAKWRADESYASFKRDIFQLSDDAGGVRGPGGMSVGALKARTGSEMNLVGPLHAMATNHADIIRKTMRQEVINKIYRMVEKNPELLGGMFQRDKLKVNIGPGGKPEYPQLKDQNYWMARENGKYKPLGVMDKGLKAVVENMLMNPDSIGGFEKAVTFISRQFVKGTTGLNPVFTVGNIPIDTISAAAQTQTGYKPFWDQYKILKKMAATEDSDEAKFLNEYLILGGHKNTLAGFLDESNTPEEMYRRMVGETTRLEKMQNGAETVMDIVSAPSKFSEDFTRAAEYIRSRQAGDTSVVAMEKAGQVSAPFHHRGTMGGRFGRATLKATAYVNPALQVAAQFAKTLGNKPTQKRAAVIMAALTTAIIGSDYAIRTASDAQRRNYRGLPVRLKQNYIWYPLPGEKARANGLLGKVKIPSNYGTVGGLLNMLIDDALMGTRYSKNEYVQMATSAIPDQLNLTDFTRMLFSWIPRIIAPAIEVKTGKRTFPEVRDLTPKDMQDLPLWQQKTEDTSYPALLTAKTRLGQALNLSPIEIDYLIEGYLGTGTRFLTMRYGKKLLTRPFYTEMYLSGMRDLEFFYKLRDQVNREYQGARELERGPEGFTATPQFERLMQFKEPVEAIDLGMKEYRAYGKIKNPTEKEQAELRKLRTDILDAVEQLWIEYEKGLDKK